MSPNRRCWSFQRFSIEFLVRQCQELLDNGFQITIRLGQHSRTHIAQPVVNSELVVKHNPCWVLILWTGLWNTFETVLIKGFNSWERQLLKEEPLHFCIS